MNASQKPSLIFLTVLMLVPAVAAALAGFLDPTFSEGGKDLILFEPDGCAYLWGTDIAVQSDGVIVVAGTVVAGGGDSDFGVARLGRDGGLDSGFGIGGEVRIAFNLGWSWGDYAEGVALQSDGKIVVVGHVEYSELDTDFAVVRLNPDGSLDTTFGQGGTTTVWFDLGNLPMDYARGVAIQPDGKILVVGTARDESPSGDQMAVARLEANGDLDFTFGSDGKIVIPFDLGGSNEDEARDIAIQPDGKILIAGDVQDADYNVNPAVAKLNQDGTLDESFGEGGRVVIPVDLGGNLYDYGRAIKVLEDGRIVIAGSAATDTSGSDFLLIRLYPNGVPDDDFGTHGVVTVPFDMGGGLWDAAYDVAIQPDGKIIAVGSVARDVGAGDIDFGVVRLLEDGSLDETFGDYGGRTVIAFDIGGGWRNEDMARAMALQPDNGILVVGPVTREPFSTAWGVVRLMNELVHLDGFESGDTSAWSVTVP